MQVVGKLSFQKVYKKLKPNQRTDVDNAIKTIIANPLIGEQKKGNLSFVRVYKFKMVKQLTLIAYSWQEDELVLTFMAVSSHENFYRDISHS